MIYRNFLKIFGSARKYPEIFEKTSKTVQKYFLDASMIFRIFGKSSEIFGSVWKSSGGKFPYVIGNIGFSEVLKRTSVNCCAQ